MNIFDYSKTCAKRLRRLYSGYARSVGDEGLRKFLNSMGEQEASHLQFLEEKFKELSGRGEVMAEAERLGKTVEEGEELKDVTDMNRVDFLSYAIELEEETMNNYFKIYESCDKEGELAPIFHSLYEEEKRHHAIVKDRYELESLM